MYFEEVESFGCRFIWRNRGWTGRAMGVRALLTAPSGQLEVVPARDTLSVFSMWSLVILPSFYRIHLSISFWADRRLAPSSPAGGSQSIISCSSETLQKNLIGRPWLQNLIEMPHYNSFLLLILHLLHKFECLMLLIWNYVNMDSGKIR